MLLYPIDNCLEVATAILRKNGIAATYRPRPVTPPQGAYHDGHAQILLPIVGHHSIKSLDFYTTLADPIPQNEILLSYTGVPPSHTNIRSDYHLQLRGHRAPIDARHVVDYVRQVVAFYKVQPAVIPPEVEDLTPDRAAKWLADYSLEHALDENRVSRLSRGMLNNSWLPLDHQGPAAGPIDNLLLAAANTLRTRGVPAVFDGSRSAEDGGSAIVVPLADRQRLTITRLDGTAIAPDNIRLTYHLTSPKAPSRAAPLHYLEGNGHLRSHIDLPAAPTDIADYACMVIATHDLEPQPPIFISTTEPVSDKTIALLVDQAEQAFYAKVAEFIPPLRAHGIDPTLAAELTEAHREAVRQWVAFNVPAASAELPPEDRTPPGQARGAS